MKQKLLTLMTLLLCAVSGAWAEDLCSAQVANGKTGTFSNTTGEAATNCTLYYSGLQGGSNAVTIGGIDYYKFGSDGAYIQLKYSGGNFIAGDVVSVMVVSNSGSKSFNLKFGKTNSSNFSCNATSATAITYTLTADDIESDGSVKIYRGSSSASNIRANVVSVTGTRKSIATQVFYGVKKGSTTLTETTDYIVDGTYYPDIQELLVSADIVVTDYSSCIFDFMLSRKPGFIYASDIKDFDEMRGFYYPLTSTPFPVSENNEQLQKNISEFDYESYKQKVEDFLKEKGCIEDGHASERVVEFIKEKMIS